MADDAQRGAVGGRAKLVRARARRRRFIVIGVVVVVAGGGATAVWAATRPAAPSYRTATAGPASVTNTLAVTGTIEPVTEATVNFPMSGQVASVSVQQGQQVSVGQTLAQLNTTQLSSAVSSAQSTVATAQAKLATDQSSQTAVTSSTTSSTPSSKSSGGSTSSSGSSAAAAKLAGLVQGLTNGQNAVRTAQQQVDKDLALVSADVKQTAGPCQAALSALSNPPTTTTPTPTSSTSATSATTPTKTPPPTGGGSSGGATDCPALITQTQTDEATASTDEHALSAAVANLATALNQAVATVGQAAGSSTSGHSGSGSTTPSASTPSGSTGGGSKGGSAQPASADQIAADQASVDSANAQLAAAQQNLAAATLLSPIAGTVAQVDLVAGQQSSANSSSAHIVIVGPGEDEVTTAVTDMQVGQVKPGEMAAVTPDGAGSPIHGKVTAIGALGTTTSSGSASYPVTISLDPTTVPLFAGATASVGITLGTSQAAVTVPTSAINTIVGFSFVYTMVNGTPTRTRVTLGVTGPTLTEVTSGLHVGDQVMLANISEPMPTSNTTNRGLIGGGGGAFRGGGGGGAGGGRTAAVPGG